MMSAERIGWLLRIGVFIAAFLGLFGLCWQGLHPDFFSHHLLRLALVILIDIQFLRVFFTLWLFTQARQWFFVFFSLIILVGVGYAVLGAQ